MSPDADPKPLRRWEAALLLWLSGNALRMTILAVPPVLATIRDDFSLSATEVGLLSSVPPALFAIASLGGSLLVMRLGLKHALVGGLLLVAAGSALRGLAPTYAMLFITTIVMSTGVAIMQPIMPTAVRQWMPQHIGTGTAIYTNGLLIGEILPVMCAAALVLPLVGGSWRMSLVAWSLPILAIALVVGWMAPATSNADRLLARESPRKWLPDWHKGLVWRLGLLFSCINTIYFSANAFLPIYLASAGRADLIGSALTALNLGQLPASLLLLACADRIKRRMWPYVLSGTMSLAGVAGIVFDVGPRTIWWSGITGFADAAALTIGLTLPPLLCKEEDVARTAAGTFTISYGSAVVLAIVGGALWDLIGIPMLAFAPIAAAAVALALVAMHMRRKGELI
ncbi:MAG: MFS transporter [Casimicrobiaceae bacterium]